MSAPLHLTTVKLNDQKGRYRSEVLAMSDANTMHKSLVTGFFSHLAQGESDSLRQRAGMLHLPVMDDRGRVQAVIMQTVEDPRGGGSELIIPPYLEVVSVREVNHILEEGAVIQFQSTISATVAVSNPNGGRGIRRVVGGRSEAAEWWNNREAGMGLRTDGKVAVSDTRVRFPSSTVGRSPIGWTYTGMATVTDPSAFAATVANGLGRSKAFGMGMMMFREVV